MKAKNFTKILLLSLLSFSVIQLTPATAEAQSGAVRRFVERIFGKSDDVKTPRQRRAPAPRQADDSAERTLDPSTSRAFRAAVEDGKILLGRTLNDPFFTEKTGKMFKSVRTRDLIKTVGQREVVDNIETNIMKNSNIGLLITGLQGIGKRRLIDMIEWTFRKSSATSNRQSWVIELDAGLPEFKNADEFRHYVRNLAEVDEIKEAKNIVFVFKNVDQYAKEQGGMAIDSHINILHHWIARARMTSDGKDGAIKVKSIFTGTESQFDNLISRQVKQDAFDVVAVRGSNEILDKQEIISRNILALDPTNTAKMNDRKLHKLTLMSNRFLPGEDSPKRAIEMFENAIARRANFMKRTTENVAENDLIKKLRTDISKLNDDLEAVQRLTGKHAQSLKEELPTQIAELESKLQRASRRHTGLVKLKEALVKAEDALEKLPRNSDKYKEVDQRLERVRRAAYTLTDDDLAHEIAIAANLPISSILKMSGRMSLKNFRQLLDETIYGQEKLKAAAMRAAEAIEYAYTTGNFPKNKPVASLFITGYQGSGKTEIATLLGQFTDGYKLFNGGDLMGDTGSALLSGAKPGYVGYEKGGELVNALAENKRLALHFDELEKVDKDVIDYLNGILNPAKATGGNGVEARSNEALFIATSNVVRQLPDNIDPDNIRDLKKLIRERAPHISPEFLDRIDEFVVVGQSTRENLSDIMTKFLDLLRKDELLTTRYLGADISNDAREKILDIVVKNEDMTGRTIMRSIKRYFEAPIKTALRDGEYLDPLNGTFREIKLKPGQNITLDVADDGGIILRAE